MTIDLEHIKNVGIGAAYGSAAILRKHFGGLTAIQKKGPEDLVTTADIESERQIVETIRAKFPDHDIYAEESREKHHMDSDCKWIIDPLDGTTNYAHQVPIFSVSIAFSVSGEIRVGIVLQPMNGELFVAVKNKGARLNDRPISVSEGRSLSEALLVTGFPYDVKKDSRPYMARFEKMLNAARGVRRLGSAAVDLCYVACGRFEGFWEEHLQPWDTAAGFLIAQEAGAKITDFSDNAYTIDKPEILATNRHVHDEMRAILNG
ncbi:MAG: inositol monophosphatase family protein [Desulfosalsimonadaceae bacterium]